MSKQVILTGLRANSELHLGNYLGGILPTVELQLKHSDKYQVNMFVPDLHSFTTPIDHTKLHQQIIDNLRVFAAAGLDITNQSTYIYRQSHIPAHSELAWILNCFTGFGELSRMTQFKDKRREVALDTIAAGNINSDLEVDTVDAAFKSHDVAVNNRVSAGLFNYPVLMAADILLYGAKYVPLGDDQKQHLELTRDLAIRLNNKFEQELFTVPEPWDEQMKFSGRENGVRIRSLRNPEKKMSKSIEDPSGTIMLSDNPKEAAKKVMRAETDSIGIIKYNFDTQPGISNLLQILALLSAGSQSEINSEWEGKTSYGDLKKAVAEAIEQFMIYFQARLSNTPDQLILNALAKDEDEMNTVANETLLRVQKAVGLR